MNREAKNILTILKVSGAFLAFLIGSGFATGQEGMQFFVPYGLPGIGGAFFFLLLGSYMTISLLLVGQKHGFKNNEEVFKYYTGEFIGLIFTWYTIVMIFSVYVLMLAASGSVLEEYYGTPVYIGSAIMACAVLATLYLGLHELIDVIGSVGPVLILLILCMAVLAVVQNPEGIKAGAIAASSLDMLKASDHWWLSGLLYTALQAVGLFSFLPALGATIENRKDLIYAGIIGPTIYFVTLCLVILALLSSMPEIYGKMIPMLNIAVNTMPFIAPFFVFIVLAGIFTTTAPLLWIVLVKFARDGSRQYKLLAIMLTVVGYIGGMTLPFDKLVNMIYPTVGASGIVLIVLMMTKQIRNRFTA